MITAISTKAPKNTMPKRKKLKHSTWSLGRGVESVSYTHLDVYKRQIHYMFRKYGDAIRIINVDALTYAGNLENLKDIEDRDNYTFIKADIRDREAIEKIFAENDIDRVVHFAAESHVDRSIVNPEIFVETNVLGTLVTVSYTHLPV